MYWSCLYRRSTSACIMHPQSTQKSSGPISRMVASQGWGWRVGGWGCRAGLAGLGLCAWDAAATPSTTTAGMGVAESGPSGTSVDRPTLPFLGRDDGSIRCGAPLRFFCCGAS